MNKKRTLRQILNEKKREWMNRPKDPSHGIEEKAKAIVERRAELVKQLRSTEDSTKRADLEKAIREQEKRLADLKNSHTRTSAISVEEIKYTVR